MTSLSSRTRHRNRDSTLVVGMLWLAVFIPGHLFDWRVELAFIAAMASIAIFLLGRRGFPRSFGTLPIADVIWPIVAITVSYITAYAINRYVNPGISGIRDYYEMLRFPILLSGLLLIDVDFSRRAIAALDTVIIASLAWIGVVFTAFVTQIPFVSGLLTGPLYGGTKTNIEPSFGHYRMSAPFENPNFLAFYLVLSLTYLLFFSRHRFRYWTSLAALVCGFLTGSRSGWIAMLIVVSLFAFELVGAAVRQRNPRLIGQAIALALIAVGGWTIAGDSVLNSARVASTAEYLKSGQILEDPNTAARIQINKEAWELFVESPAIGTGSAKYSEIDVIDNQYMTWLLRTGLFGFVMLLLIFGRVAIAQVRAARRSNRQLGVASFWIGAGVMLLAGAFLENFRLMFLFWYFVFAIWPSDAPRQGAAERY